jgi:hypothetical protein
MSLVAIPRTLTAAGSPAAGGAVQGQREKKGKSLVKLPHEAQ